MDWRLWVIVGVAALCILATLVVWWAGLGHEPTTFFGAIFAAWIAGLALFVITGILVAVVSLARPERESFDARARILFRKQSGRHIDHIVERIRNALEHYTETTSIKIMVLNQHTPEKKLRISCETSSVIKSYIDDTTCTFPSKLRLSEITSPPPHGEPNRVLYLRINGIPFEGCQTIFQNEYEFPYDLTIEPHGSCQVERCSQIWVRSDGEENSHTPNRYTKALTLEFENRLVQTQVRVEISRDSGASWEEFILAPGRAHRALHVADAPPDKEIYRYRLSVI